MKLRLASLAVLALAVPFGPSAQAAPENFEIDAIHSAVIFRAKHFDAGYTYGRFNGISGKFVFDAEKPETSTVEVTVDASSVDTNSPDRDKHLRSPDFFDVAKFPAITFKSTAVKKSSDTQFEVTGNLTLHGTTKAVTVMMEKTGAATDKWGGYRMGFEGVITLKRSDYGMSTMIPSIGDDIRLTLAIEGLKK